ncbi:MAG: hypothetical protein R3C44_00880 [Chloroflexota bacterium]
MTQPPGQNLQVSWRLQDATGAILTQLDTQPGYGFQPTAAWPVGEAIHDRLALRLPDSLSGNGPYPLVMILYDPASGEQPLLRRLGELVEDEGELAYQPLTPTFTLPEGSTSLDLSLSEDGQPLIGLKGYALNQFPDSLEVALYWQALAGTAVDYLRFVHLIDTTTGDIVAQVDGYPSADSYPTSQWQTSEIVTDNITFDTQALPPGTYQVATGFYRSDGDGARLEANDITGPLPDGRLVLPENITLP